MRVRNGTRRLVIVAAVAAILAGDFASVPGHADPPADPSSIWTLQDENASISTAKLTDRYYTNGLRLGWTSGTDDVPDFLERAGRAAWGEGRNRVSVDITQQIYTPADTEARNPPLGDRPYAGVLLANFGLIHDTDASRSVAGLALGIVGPDALGEDVQNGFHDLIGQRGNKGWRTQLHDEPALQTLLGRTWRLPLGTVGGLETDTLPELEVGLGTVRVYAQTGARIRIGQGLEADFGPARLRPGATGGDAFARNRAFGWYAFFGLDGRLVAHDVTLDGNTWRDSRSVSLTPYVGEAEFGLAVLAYGARLTYTQVVQTQEFRHQKGGPHQFGALALSVRF